MPYFARHDMASAWPPHMQFASYSTVNGSDQCVQRYNWKDDICYGHLEKLYTPLGSHQMLTHRYQYLWSLNAVNTCVYFNPRLYFHVGPLFATLYEDYRVKTMFVMGVLQCNSVGGRMYIHLMAAVIQLFTNHTCSKGEVIWWHAYALAALTKHSVYHNRPFHE